MSTDVVDGLNVLIVDDEADIRLGLRRLLGPLGVTIRDAESGRAAIQLLARAPADLVITDVRMPGMSGVELLAHAKHAQPQTEVVVMTGYGTIEMAVACLQNGAAHFLAKPFDNQEIVRVVQRLGRQVLGARERRARVVPEIIAEDPRMVSLLELVARVAKTPVPVLIEGDSGTGKEMIARLIHAQSSVASSPFLAVNAAALPDTLLESELFGHVKGAFTGADKDRSGLFAEASGGTVFLDEVSCMSLAFQAKLLRVLQEKIVRPLGGSRDVPVDFRLVAATNRDLAAMIRAGQFREDLYYRLRVVSLQIPPLRERPGDIVPLVRHFLARATQDCLGANATAPTIADAALNALRAHRWLGNVRELENTMQRAVVVCHRGVIEPHHLGLRDAPPRVGDAVPADAVAGDDYEAAKRRVIESFQREFVERALERSSGNVSQAAESCGLTRAAFQRIMRQLQIERASFA